MFSNYWYEKGAKDIQSGLNLKRIEHAAKNVILFIGDGMGVSTQTGGHRVRVFLLFLMRNFSFAHLQGSKGWQIR